ncbi:protein-L-isoaspartate O-methyltransferase [Candidatus Jorgensenbacteria bacterium CG10_big_fil_rev_8_21_14_0_10_54_38]|uniref:Protein-L-isoaspartate O-methyltransferase n=2 Tax=Candidatus Joergenseniibacteriota TaxID=1752739 RepID=A0A2M6WFH5_9BACT|nr:MAG: protein-L-isoaspartate O-methyltransferase [Candidatus Jorgensenbacteria bacterium CG23_combo_of_CG06-09_8_20_14_all_54_14]PIT91526.1 MAG: protein-L-isoaspartate O-methyltransferase [Candidatus Jorgensenbacteria bacterium CG10_big_fil_rev_8_21_14_0_10_54_38]
MTNDDLVDTLVAEGYLKTHALIAAFRAIDRARFVPEKQQEEAYGNYPLSIGFGQTISQPLTVAFMLEELQPRAGEKVLDVGAGSGWQTALLAQCVGGSGKVIAMERVPQLAVLARGNVGKFDFLEKKIAEVVAGDAVGGYPQGAPFDKIIAAASAREIPVAWKEQLRVGGKIVAPVGESIVVLEKKGENDFEKKQFFGFQFVPLISRGRGVS